MRHVIITLLIFTFPAYGAFNAGMAWDVRTTGSDSNGGGFDSTVSSPGTNYSLQNSAQVALTDLVIGATTTQGTSVLHPFDSTSPGNVVNVVSGSGCTVQRVEILSVSGVTATFDKTLGTAASVCTGNLGGSLLTFCGGMQAPFGNVNLPTAVWFKSGTYTLTTGCTIDNSNFSGINYTVTGYGSTHGDGGTRPLITTATNSTKLLKVFNGWYLFSNMNWSNTAGTQADGIWSGSSNPLVATQDCTFDGFNVALNGDNGAGSPMSAYLMTTEIKNSVSDGVRMFYTLDIRGSWIHANGGDGIKQYGTCNINIEDSVISANTGIGVEAIASSGIGGAAGNIRIYHSDVAANTGDGIKIANPVYLCLGSSAVTSNGGYGVNAVSAGTISTQNTLVCPASGYNAYGLNTSGAVNNTTTSTGDVTTVSVIPFTSSSDFSLNSTAGGGALLRSAGFPGVTPFGTGYTDIGALQHASAAAVVPICSIGQ